MFDLTTFYQIQVQSLPFLVSHSITPCFEFCSNCCLDFQGHLDRSHSPFYFVPQESQAGSTKGKVRLPNLMNFRKSAKGGGSFAIQKFILQIWGTSNRAFWAWNWCKIIISGFRVCFFNNFIEKNQNKTHFEEGSSSHNSLRNGSRYQIGWISERFQTAVDPHPPPSELSLSLEIMYMHFILSGHHTSSHICIHVCHKKLQYNLPNMRGGGLKAVWNFSKSSSDLEAGPFPKHCFILKHYDQHSIWTEHGMFLFCAISIGLHKL